MAVAKKKSEKSESTKVAASNSMPKIRIKVLSHDHKVIDYCVAKIVDTVSQSGAIIAGPIPLPVEKKIFTVNKSTFVNKDAREQFELRTHKRLIDIVESTPKTMELLNHLDLPAGVDVQIKLV